MCLYIALSPPVGKPIYDLLIFPDCGKYDLGYGEKTVCGVTAHDVWFTAAGHKLHGWLFAKPGAQLATIIHHGQSSNLACPDYRQFIALMLQAGTSVFIYDYEGYGRSEGQPDLANLCRDGSAAEKCVCTTLHLAQKQIVHFGISLGTGVACHVASTDRSAAVILVSPYTSFLEVAKSTLPFLRLYPDWSFFQYDNIDSREFFRHAHQPVLIFSGARDQVIPVAESDYLAASAVQPVAYVRYADAGHTQIFGTHSNRTLERIKLLLGECVQPVRRLLAQ